MASDLLDYKGLVPVEPGGVDASNNATNVINRMLDGVATRAYDMKVREYQQKIQDRNDQYKLLATTNINVPVVDSDRTILQKKIKEIEDFHLANPDAKSDPKKWIQLQNMSNDYQDMLTSAKHRYIGIAGKKQEYADNPNPYIREQLAKNIKQDEDGGIEHNVDPYQDDFTWSDHKGVVLYDPANPETSNPRTRTTLAETDVPGQSPIVKKTTVTDDGLGVSGSGTRSSAGSAGAGKQPVFQPGDRLVNKNGFMYVQKQKHTPIADFYAHYYAPDSYKPDKNNIMPYAIADFYQKSLNTPQTHSDEWANFINSKLEEANRKEGLKPTDIQYLKPAFAKNDNGSWNITPDPRQYAMDVSVAMNYKHSTDLTPSKEAQEIATIKAHGNEYNAAAGLSGAKAATENYLRNKKGQLIDSEIFKNLQAGEKDAAEGDKIVSKPVTDVVNTFNAINSKGEFKPIKSGTSDNPLNSVGSMAAFNNAKTVGVGDDWQYTDIPSNDLPSIKMLSVPVEQNVGTKLNPSMKKVMQKPDRIMAFRSADGNEDNLKLVGFDKDGKVLKAVDLSQGINEMISAENGDDKGNTVSVESKAQQYINKLQGGNYGEVSLKRIRQHLGSSNSNNAQQTQSGWDEQKEVGGKKYGRRGNQWFELQ